MASLYIMSLHKRRRHRGGRPGSTAALPPSRPNRTSVSSNGRTPDQPTSPASQIPTALPEAPTASKPNPVPNPQPSTFPAQTGGSGLAGLIPPTSSSASGPRVFPLRLPFGRHLVAGSSASGQPPSSRATETKRPGRGLPLAPSRLPPAPAGCGGRLLTSSCAEVLTKETELAVSTELAAASPASLYIVIGSPALPAIPPRKCGQGLLF